MLAISANSLSGRYLDAVDTYLSTPSLSLCGRISKRWAVPLISVVAATVFSMIDIAICLTLTASIAPLIFYGKNRSKNLLIEMATHIVRIVMTPLYLLTNLFGACKGFCLNYERELLGFDRPIIRLIRSAQQPYNEEKVKRVLSELMDEPSFTLKEQRIVALANLNLEKAVLYANHGVNWATLIWPEILNHKNWKELLDLFLSDQSIDQMHEGQTLLMLACNQFNHDKTNYEPAIDIINDLIARGANSEILAADGKRAMDYLFLKFAYDKNSFKALSMLNFDQSVIYQKAKETFVSLPRIQPTDREIARILRQETAKNKKGKHPVLLPPLDDFLGNHNIPKPSRLDSQQR